jgi:hypothetical protein
MKKSDVTIGATYLLKVAGNLVPVTITREHPGGGWEGTSVKTGKRPSASRAPSACGSV